MHAEQVWLVYVAHYQMWDLINVYRIFPGEKRHDTTVLMSVGVYLADGLAISIAKQQKSVVNT